MSPKARYKTQSNIWDVEITGRLTDKAITAYALAGRYGPEVQQHYRRVEAANAKPLVPKRRTRSAFMALFASL